MRTFLQPSPNSLAFLIRWSCQSSSTYAKLVAFLLVAMASSKLSAQQHDPTNTVLNVSVPKFDLAKRYEAAREAFRQKKWREAMELFREVGTQCPNSQLCLQSNYYAMLAEHESKDSNCDRSVGIWLTQAKKYQEGLAKQQTVPAGFDAWVTTAQLIKAKWDRQSNRLEDAEKRLRALVSDVNNGSPFAGEAWPRHVSKLTNVWIELGSVLADSRRDWVGAKQCYEQAIASSEGSGDDLCAALHGAASCSVALEDWSAASEFSERLSRIATADDWKIRAAILQSKLKRQAGLLAEAGQALEPIVSIALAGNPQVVLIYELALALLEAEQNSSANELLVNIVHREPNSPYAIEARVRLARSAQDRDDLQESKNWLDDAIGLGCSGLLSSHAHLLRGNIQLKWNHPERAKPDFEMALAVATDDVALETSIRFELAETLYQLNEWDQASKHWDWLIAQANRLTPSEGMPAWLATVLLRQAELLALKQSWDDAEKLVYRIRTDFPECSRHCEVDYLLARCHVSKARFDDARKVLQSIAERPDGAPAELIARVWWMTGETYVMQRKYAEALQAYRHVLETDNASYWHGAALLQMGQCYSLVFDNSSAKQAYQYLIDTHPESDFATTALERIKTLPVESNVANRLDDKVLGTKR